jgi:hypothetical protein
VRRIEESSASESGGKKRKPVACVPNSPPPSQRNPDESIFPVVVKWASEFARLIGQKPFLVQSIVGRSRWKLRCAFAWARVTLLWFSGEEPL